jgi:hypothetical protein
LLLGDHRNWEVPKKLRDGAWMGLSAATGCLGDGLKKPLSSMRMLLLRALPTAM